MVMRMNDDEGKRSECGESERGGREKQGAGRER
jgi:hypothetical protein